MDQIKKHPLITGAFILTITGLITRIIGFFYRIYLSQLFGEEGMGIYQLLSPILALSFSITAAGIQTSISKYVASEVSTKNYKTALRVLLAGLFLSLTLSGLCMLFIIKCADWIAVAFLLEPRTASMLRIIALSIPMGAVHSCINGYFYGIKKTGVPSATQLVEQIFRVGSVAIITHFLTERGSAPSINVAVLGLVIGEGAAMVISIFAAYQKLAVFSNCKAASLQGSFWKSTLAPYAKIIRNLSTLALPLTANRLVINFLSSIEAIYIPNRLLAYGYDTKTALSVYGVLTGMAMPLIMFPNALTNSVSVLLLPMISEADATGNQNLIRKAVAKTIRYSTILGVGCMAFFLVIGKPAGTYLFNSPLAGHFILTLSFICPFMYLSATLSSIINGLGKAGFVFVSNIISLLLRLVFVFGTIPFVGIKGYLWGLLLSQIFTAFSFVIYLLKRK